MTAVEVPAQVTALLLLQAKKCSDEKQNSTEWQLMGVADTFTAIHFCFAY